MSIPSKLRKQLEESGVKFDENGNMIEDENESFFELAKNLTNQNSDTLDDEKEDELNQDEQNIGEEQSDEEPEITEDDSDDENGEQDDKVAEKEKPAQDNDVSKTKLTPRKKIEKDPNTDKEILELRESVKALLEREKKSEDKNDIKDDGFDLESIDQNTLKLALEEMKREAQEFKKARFKAFADSVKERVNRKSYGVDFDEIINSAQWEEFLNKKAYGSRIGDLYKGAISSQDTESVVYFFDDFSKKYLNTENSDSKSGKQNSDNLDDLAVPDKTKASNSPKKRSKYDFEESDLAKQTDLLARGRINRETFDKFYVSFEKALSEGRVKQS